MERDQFRSCYEMAVRWGDVDVQGHVNHAQFLCYLETARSIYFRQHLGLTMGGGKAGFVLAEITCSYRQQLLFPNTVEVLTRVGRLGRSSLTVQGAVFRVGEKQPLVTSSCVLVWFDFAEQRSAPLPDRIIDAVTAYEPQVPER